MWMIILLIIGIVLIKIGIEGEKEENSNSAYISNQTNNKTTTVRKRYPVIDWEATWKPTGVLKASGKCGKDVNWALYDDGQLIITGNGPMNDYEPETKENGKLTPWYPYRLEIRSAKVGKGITYLGAWVFGYCKNLEDVTLSCTCEKMPWGGFYGCEKLQKIIVPYGVEWICGDCFLACSALREVYLPEGLKEIGGAAFAECPNLEKINLPESLTDIEDYAFGHCISLRGICIPSGVTYIHRDAFFKSGMNVPAR